MRNALLMIAFGILVLLTVPATGGTDPQSEPPAKAKAAKPLKIGQFVFEGGDGSTIEQAVVIRNAKNEEEGVAAESKWIKKVHPGWQKGMQALLMPENGRKYDRIDYTTPKGDTQTIYFDISEFFGKM
jgi:hypothetical protein